MTLKVKYLLKSFLEFFKSRTLKKNESMLYSFKRKKTRDAKKKLIAYRKKKLGSSLRLTKSKLGF